jgi:hypothetical protein
MVKLVDAIDLIGLSIVMEIQVKLVIKSMIAPIGARYHVRLQNKEL